jgi:phosphoglycolate phosphatase
MRAPLYHYGIMDKYLIIFDLDGTLVDAYPAIIASLNFTLKALGLAQKSPREIRKAVGWGDVSLLKPFFSRRDLKRAIRIYRRHHESSLRRSVRLMPYAGQLLACLHANGFKLAIASNRPTRFTCIILKKLKLEKFFDKVLCGDRVRFRKPHPQILNTLVRNFKIAKGNVLYVGDMVLDVQTGRRAGIKTAAVATGSSSWSDLKKARPTYLLRNLKELKQECQRAHTP